MKVLSTIYLSLCLLLLALVLPFSAFAHDTGDFSSQSATWFSTIVPYDDDTGTADDIHDWELSGWLKDNLEPTGTPKYQDLKFVFQQCFGGGFLDDLTDDLTGLWIGSSASRDTSPSWADFADTQDEYTKAWKNATPTVMKARHDQARENDPGAYKRGPYVPGADHAKYPEHPQVTGEGATWQNIDLAAAASLHAILFSGGTEQRHWNDIKNVRNVLINEGFPVGNIKIYSHSGTTAVGFWKAGDPTPDGAGTKANMKLAIENVAPLMSTSEQLFIYVTDHGSKNNYTEELEEIIPGFFNFDSTFTIDLGFLADMDAANPPGPALTLTTRDVTSAANDVYLNGNFLGFLSVTGLSATGTDSFSIDSSMLYDDGSPNYISIYSAQSENLYFSKLSVGTGPVPQGTKTNTGEDTYPYTITGFIALMTGAALVVKRQDSLQRLRKSKHLKWIGF